MYIYISTYVCVVYYIDTAIHCICMHIYIYMYLCICVQQMYVGRQLDRRVGGFIDRCR